MLKLPKLIPLPPAKTKGVGEDLRTERQVVVFPNSPTCGSLSKANSNDCAGSPGNEHCSGEDAPRRKYIPLLALPKKPPAATSAATFIHHHDHMPVDELRPKTQGGLPHPVRISHQSPVKSARSHKANESFRTVKENEAPMINRHKAKVLADIRREGSNSPARRDNSQSKQAVKLRMNKPNKEAGKKQADARGRRVVRFASLAYSVKALLSLCNMINTRQCKQEKALAALACMRTLGGGVRMRRLPLYPLTTHADQGARDEICCVAPGLWQCNWRGAERREEMLQLQVHSVLSALSGAEGCGESAFPDTFEYMGVEIEDSDDQDLRPHLTAAIAFVRTGVAKGGCLVHCAAGISRSSAVVLAYLMQEYRFTLREAFVALRERRPISWPNPGFMRQLIALEHEIMGGICSLNADEYVRWGQSNQDGVDLARFVDRDRAAFRPNSRSGYSA